MSRTIKVYSRKDLVQKQIDECIKEGFNKELTRSYLLSLVYQDSDGVITPLITETK